MKLEWSTVIRQRMASVRSRLNSVQQSLAAAHQQLQTVAAHKDWQAMQVKIGQLQGDQFEVTFAGLTLVACLEPEISAAGVGMAKLSFYEKLWHSTQPPRLVGSIKVTPNGQTDCTDPDGDELALIDCLPEVLLTSLEQVLRKRAD